MAGIGLNRGWALVSKGAVTEVLAFAGTVLEADVSSAGFLRVTTGSSFARGVNESNCRMHHALFLVGRSRQHLGT